MDDVGYETMVEMINEWAKKNAATLCDQFVAGNDVEGQHDNKHSRSEVMSILKNKTQKF